MSRSFYQPGNVGFHPGGDILACERYGPLVMAWENIFHICLPLPFVLHFLDEPVLQS
jgi:hypothetical protein